MTTSGPRHAADLRALHGGGVPEVSGGEHGRGHLHRQRDVQAAGVPGEGVVPKDQ